MQQASKREQLELDELLSDIYRGIERLPDEPATTSPSPTQAKANNNNANSNNYNNNTLNKSLSQDNQHYNYNDYQFFNNNNNNISNDSAYDRYFNQQPATNHHHHTVSFATTARRSSKELTERQIKEKAMIEELKRNFKSGALTLRNSFKSPSSTSSSNNKDNNNKTTTNNTNTTNNNNLTAKRYNTTNNRSTSRSPTPNRVTFMRQHSDLTNYRAPQSTKAVNQLKQHTMSSNNRIASSPVRVSEYHLQAEQQLPSTHYTINQQLIVPNGNGSNGTKQQSILTSHSSNTMQPQQKTIYANPHNSLLQHKREQQINNKANLNKCSMKEFDELDSLLNSLKITSSPTTNNYMNNNNNDRNNGQVNRTQNYLSPSSSTPYNKNNIYNSNSTNEPSQTTNALNNYQQQNSDTNVPLYAKVQKNTPIQSNTIQNYNYKSANNYGQQQQQQFNARERNIPVQTTHNNTTTTYYNPNINLSNNGNSNDYGNNEDDNNDGNHVHHTTIENNQHQPIYGHYHEQQNQQHHSENQDPPFDILPSMEYYQLLSKFNTVKNDYWYKPKMSRETAINLLKDKPPGTFIVRDSTSFNGAYGLAVKVSKLPRNIITSTNLRNPNTTSPNELIRHFLIESTTKGVRLKGYANEPVFSSLPALVYQHSITELALPCKLSIPRADVEDPMFAEKQKRFYEEVLAEKIDNTKGIYGNSGVLGGMRNYDGVPIHSEHRIIFDII